MYRTGGNEFFVRSGTCGLLVTCGDRGWNEGLVAQICPRWNRLADWLRAAEGYAAAA
jgi:hypothetical protein